MGKSTISMAIFNSKLLIYQRVLTSRFRRVPYWLGCGCGDPPPAAGAVGWWQVVNWIVNYVRKHVSIIEDWPCIVDVHMVLRKIDGQDMQRYYVNKQLIISNSEIQALSRQARNARPCRHRLWEVPSPVSLGQLHRDSENGALPSVARAIEPLSILQLCWFINPINKR